ncbi:RICIN domain-containing protein [Sinosporangium siamense]|uniref:RICIN domain-containing protein n=1 Tax=Sinosporangium siamense TaxID=1367973 RepID=UPI00194FD07B|nr:RICIN domain-containing protein [Sinosporangium siamense]
MAAALAGSLLVVFAAGIQLPALSSASVNPPNQPDLSFANRVQPPAGLPDWSRVGYLGGQRLPGDGEVNGEAACRITAQQLASGFGVVADDGVDDTTGLQNAIDQIKNQCSSRANYHRLSLISLPAGRIDVSRQIYVDASFLILRGQGSGAGGTRLVFRPDVDTRYDTLSGDGSRWNQDGMEFGSGSDLGKGGWIWPGRAMFRVQTRDVADRYQNEWQAAPANRKDLFEGSVNQHWASGIRLAARADDAGYSAREGQSVVKLVSTADMNRFSLGGYVWVGAANSINFYAQQDVTSQSLMENLHMRQQMFRVVRKDTTAKTITLDRPLEYDLPVDSTSDGSPPMFGTVYPSKVTPLKAVEGVGFENFAMTQDMTGLPKLGGGTYALSPSDAVNNYGNMAPEYAMHGILFKWAANSWARGLNATMVGSHPIVTEVARNLQIERNTFDGAWNKGKGGNGYLRGSRVWDSLYAYNTSRNLRHFTFQWSASGNVVFRNDLDSDLNLHGGWERFNLFEGNTVRIPYAHRSGNCAANCGGEGGETDDGTWYPIWWAAGPKAAKWSGSSGPQNVFFNNTLIKQTTPGGQFTTYTPYSMGSPGVQADTFFQFGSDNADPRRFRPLSQGGQGIPDWTGRETLDYNGHGVVARVDGRRPSLFLRDVGQLDPRQNGSRRMATWNMQGSGTRGGWAEIGNEYESKYSYGVLPLAVEHGAEIVLLQEAGSPPGGGTHVTDHPQNNFAREDGSYPPVREYRYGGTASRPQGYLYWLHTDTSTRNPPNRVNLAVATRTQVPAADIFVVESPMNGGRPALGVNIGGVVYFTVHGWSGTGNDMAGLVNRIATWMQAAGPNGAALEWAVLGDFNRDPQNLQTTLNNNYGAGRFTVHSPPSPTHPTIDPQRRLDYAVLPAAGTLHVTQSTVLNSVLYSDHLPVRYELGGLPNTNNPPQLAVTVPAPPGTAVLRNAGTTNVATALQGISNAVTDLSYSQSQSQSQSWNLYPEPEFPGRYRLVSRLTGDYMGQEGGASNARVVQWPHEANDQLWRPVYQGDGTWTLENMVTDQMLTADGGGAVLRGRDADGSARQRWFLQDPGEMQDLAELGLAEPTPERFVIDVSGGHTAENTPVILYPDHDAPHERFTRIPAGQTGGEDCNYLVYGGRYLNTTATSSDPLSGNGVTLNSFRPNNDGYLWCERNVTGGIALSNYSFQTRLVEERMYLTEHGLNNQLTITAGHAADTWSWLPVTQ